MNTQHITIIRLKKRTNHRPPTKNSRLPPTPIVHINGSHPQTWSGFRPDLIDHLVVNQ